MQNSILLKSLIFSCFVFCIEMLYANDTLVSENKVWSNLRLTYNRIPNNTAFIKFVTDNDVAPFFKIMVSDDSLSTWHWNSKSIREDSGKIYLDDGYSIYTLYDFNLEPGDTFIRPQIDTLLVTSVAYREIAEQIRKTITLKAAYSPDSVVWVEGMGSLSGILENGGDIGKVGGYDLLLCYEENGVSKYQNPDYNSCYLTYQNSLVPNNSTPPKTIHVSAVPNPFSSSISIANHSYHEAAKISIITINGHIVCQDKVAAGQSITWMSKGLGSGVYVIRAKVGGIIYTKKIILQQ
ncbi:MAG: hypothetical protein A2293_01645 [Elusimicrobia bacterium RIFOXYB2_FULL_49_7]|nr:MAG: hypothetical protein A2293_01645 [Elusimicrobia bacterium RIFOXYB2_FULL_49_7]